MGFAVSGIMVGVGLATLFIFTGPSFGLRKGYYKFLFEFFFKFGLTIGESAKLLLCSHLVNNFSPDKCIN